MILCGLIGYKYSWRLYIIIANNRHCSLYYLFLSPTLSNFPIYFFFSTSAFIFSVYIPPFLPASSPSLQFIPGCLVSWVSWMYIYIRHVLEKKSLKGKIHLSFIHVHIKKWKITNAQKMRKRDWKKKRLGELESNPGSETIWASVTVEKTWNDQVDLR